MNEKGENSKDGKKEKPQLASFKSMFLGLTGCDKFMYILAMIFATLNGCAMPTFAILFSEMIDSFDPDTKPSELVGKYYFEISLKLS